MDWIFILKSAIVKRGLLIFVNIEEQLSLDKW